MTEKNIITRYLHGELEGAELTKFTLKLARDAEFRKEVEAERLLHEMILLDQKKFNPNTPPSDSGG